MRRQGVALTVAVVAWGTAVAVSGLAHQLWLVVVLLAVAGAADLVSAVYRQTILQTYAPDEMRGRMQGVFIAVVAGGPRLGDVRAGAMAAATSATVSWVGGGVACVVVVLVAAIAVRPFWRYDGVVRTATSRLLRAKLSIMTLTGQQFTISAGDYAATWSRSGRACERSPTAASDVTATYPETELPPKCCGGVLVPWPNRLRGGTYTFDGVSYQLPLTEPLAQRDPRARPLGALDAGRAAGIDHARHRPRAADGWPFEVRVEVTYALHARAGLVVTARASNNGVSPAPFGAGFHPYLSMHGQPLNDVTLRFPRLGACSSTRRSSRSVSRTSPTPRTTCASARSFRPCAWTTRSPGLRYAMGGAPPRCARGRAAPGCGSTRRSATCRCSRRTTSEVASRP